MPRPDAPSAPAAPDLVVHAARAVVDDRLQPVSVHVAGGVVRALGAYDPATRGGEGARVVVLAEDEVLVPGLVDTHVHVNEPGRTEWEGFDAATAAALAAGVTTIVDMPLNSLPPTLDPRSLDLKRRAARGGVRVDVGFWGGLVPDNVERVPALLAAGALGVKCFLQDSGVPEFPPVSPAQLRRGAEVVASVDGLLLVHAEDPAVLGAAPVPDGRSYAAFLASRPAEAEAAAVRTVVDVARATGCRCHVVHVSSAAGVEEVRRARAEGLAVSGETCPHYLVLDAGRVPDGAPAYKCCPPIRSAEDADALWEALTDGTLRVVVTDHSPSTPAMKHVEDGDLGAAWGGVAGLQFGFAAVLTEAVRRGHRLVDVVRWMARGPADLVGLDRKGRIAVGADADLVALAPDETFTVTAGRVLHRHPVTPYLGAELRGVARRVWLRGHEVGPDHVTGRLL